MQHSSDTILLKLRTLLWLGLWLPGENFKYIIWLLENKNFLILYLQVKLGKILASLDAVAKIYQ